MKKRDIGLLVCAMTGALLLGACGKDQTDFSDDKEPAGGREESMGVSEQVEESAVSQDGQEGDVKEPGVQEEQEPAEASGTADFSFADVDGVYFCFSSGVGAWATELSIKADGSFSGVYHDADMGDSGEDYPNGTIYSCVFDGVFAKPERLNAYTYVTRIEKMEYEEEAGTEEIVDGTKYVYSEAYGLTGDGDFYFYLPGTPLEKLPVEYLSWVGYHNLSNVEETELPFYGLYNVAEGDGFSGYKAEPFDVDEYLKGIAEQADGMEKTLQTGDLTQIEMNLLSGEIYRLWDEALNEVWGHLKETLDEEEMEKVRAEEREWIKEKEAKIAEEGEQWGMGSIRPLMEAEVGAALTRERVYELAAYFK